MGSGRSGPKPGDGHGEARCVLCWCAGQCLPLRIQRHSKASEGVNQVVALKLMAMASGQGFIQKRHGIPTPMLVKPVEPLLLA